MKLRLIILKCFKIFWVYSSEMTAECEEKISSLNGVGGYEIREISIIGVGETNDIITN